MQQATFGLMVAVTNEQAIWLVAGVKCHAVSRVEFLLAVPLFAEMHEVLAGLVELENVIACVTICQYDVSVSCDGDRSRIEFV